MEVHRALIMDFYFFASFLNKVQSNYKLYNVANLIKIVLLYLHKKLNIIN